MQDFEKIRHRAPFVPFLGTKKHVNEKLMESLKKNQNSVQMTTFSMAHNSVTRCLTVALACPSHSVRIQIPAQRKHPERSLITQISVKTKLQEPSEREVAH